ncbi:MAG: hypothetical protein JW940_28600 [Polyangiaceae bacterium]|nr:hypothetical protein [Polyangiaceae bacterium]
MRRYGFVGLLLSACCPSQHPAVTVSVPVSGAAREGITARQKTDDPRLLQLRIAPFEHDGPALGYLRLVLANLSNEWLWVNYRLAISTREDPNREVWLDVTRARTREAVNRGDCQTTGSVPSTDNDYLVLRPHGEYSAVTPLGCNRFPDAGPFRIVAHYQDVRPDPPPPPFGAKWFTGALTSNAIEMTLKPGPPYRRAAHKAGEPSATPTQTGVVVQ